MGISSNWMAYFFAMFDSEKGFLGAMVAVNGLLITVDQLDLDKYCRGRNRLNNIWWVENWTRSWHQRYLDCFGTVLGGCPWARHDKPGQISCHSLPFYTFDDPCRNRPCVWWSALDVSPWILKFKNLSSSSRVETSSALGWKWSTHFPWTNIFVNNRQPSSTHDHPRWGLCLKMEDPPKSGFSWYSCVSHEPQDAFSGEKGAIEPCNTCFLRMTISNMPSIQ